MFSMKKVTSTAKPYVLFAMQFWWRMEAFDETFLIPLGSFT